MLPSDYGIRVGDLVFSRKNNHWGLGLVMPRENAILPWPIWWFKHDYYDRGFAHGPGDLIKLEIPNE